MLTGPGIPLGWFMRLCEDIDPIAIKSPSYRKRERDVTSGEVTVAVVEVVKGESNTGIRYESRHFIIIRSRHTDAHQNQIN